MARTKAIATQSVKTSGRTETSARGTELAGGAGDSSAKAQLRAARERSPLLGRAGFLIRRIYQVHCSLFLEETRDFNITPVQCSLMTMLAARGELDQNTLALEIGLERTSVAEVIPRLQARGLVERKQSPTDARFKLVKLTRKGRDLVAKMDAAVQRAHDRTVEALPEAQREQLMLQLLKLVEAGSSLSSVPYRMPD